MEGDGVYFRKHRRSDFLIKITEKILENLKIILYNWVNSWYDNQAGLNQKLIFTRCSVEGER